MTRSNSKVPESRDTKVSARKFLAQFGKKKSSKTVASKISNKYAKISKFTKTSDTDKNSIKKPQDVKIEKKTKVELLKFFFIFKFNFPISISEKFRNDGGRFTAGCSGCCAKECRKAY